MTSALLAAAILAFGQPDLIEAARRLAVETIQTPIILLDEQQHVLELNPFAERLLDTEASRAAGRPISQLWSGWPTDLGATAAFEVSHSKLGEGVVQGVVGRGKIAVMFGEEKKLLIHERA